MRRRGQARQHHATEEGRELGGRRRARDPRRLTVGGLEVAGVQRGRESASRGRGVGPALGGGGGEGGFVPALVLVEQGQQPQVRGPATLGRDPGEQRGAGQELQRRMEHEGIGGFGARDADTVGHVAHEHRLRPGRRAEIVVPAGGALDEVGIEGRRHVSKVEVEVNFMSSTDRDPR